VVRFWNENVEGYCTYSKVLTLSLPSIPCLSLLVVRPTHWEQFLISLLLLTLGNVLPAQVGVSITRLPVQC